MVAPVHVSRTSPMRAEAEVSFPLDFHHEFFYVCGQAGTCLKPEPLPSCLFFTFFGLEPARSCGRLPLARTAALASSRTSPTCGQKDRQHTASFAIIAARQRFSPNPLLWPRGPQTSHSHHGLGLRPSVSAYNEHCRDAQYLRDRHGRVDGGCR